MIYKNATIYQFTTTAAALGAHPTQEQLQERAFAPCTAMQPQSVGWSPLCEDSEEMTRDLGTAIQFCMKVEEKVMPPAAINRALADKVKEIETEQGRKVFRKERLTLKDDIIAEMLPRAFTRQKLIHAHIDRTTATIVIDTPSATVAEQVLNLLRETVGSVPVTTIDASTAPGFRLLTREPIGKMKASAEARLEYPGEQGSIAIKYEELDSEEVQAHLHLGMVPTQIRAAFEGIGAATITDTLALRRIRIAENLIMEGSEDADGAIERADADFIITQAAIRDMYTELVQHFCADKAAAAAA